MTRYKYRFPEVRQASQRKEHRRVWSRSAYIDRHFNLRRKHTFLRGEGGIPVVLLQPLATGSSNFLPVSRGSSSTTLFSPCYTPALVTLPLQPLLSSENFLLYYLSRKETLLDILRCTLLFYLNKLEEEKIKFL